MSEVIIRPSEKKDNEQIAALIRKVLVDLGVPKVGTAYADKALDDIYQAYNVDRAIYFVVEDNGVLIGGAGIAQLENYDGNVCELQKMYFLEVARGRRLGSTMLQKCIVEATAFKFDKCYLETMTYMKAAQALYKKKGFDYIDGPLGDTGHFSCPVQMLKIL
jgi:putative acetyltransferase